MAGSPIVDSARRGGLLSSVSARLTNSAISPILTAAVSAALFALAAAPHPLSFLCALIAPLPLLAIAPEVPARTASQLAFVAYFAGNLVSSGRREFYGAADHDVRGARRGRNRFCDLRRVRGRGDAAMVGDPGALVSRLSRPPFISASPDNLRTAPGAAPPTRKSLSCRCCRPRRGSACAA